MDEDVWVGGVLDVVIGCSDADVYVWPRANQHHEILKQKQPGPIWLLQPQTLHRLPHLPNEEVLPRHHRIIKLGPVVRIAFVAGRDVSIMPLFEGILPSVQKDE